MGDGPGSAIKDKVHKADDHGLRAEPVTVVHFPRDGRPTPTKRDVNSAPTILAQATDPPAPLSPAEQANREIADHQQKALVAAKAHDTVTADRELKAAITVADSNQPKAKQLLADFNKTSERERQALVTALGLDPAHATTADIEKKLNSGKLTPAQIDRLETLQTQLDAIRHLQEAPAAARAMTAFLKANGAMDAASTAPQAEQERVFQANSQEAMQLLRDAKRLDVTHELADSKAFQTVDATVNKRYQDYQSYLADTAFAAVNAGDKIMMDPAQKDDPVKKALAQAQFEAAYAAAQKLDLGYISAHQDVLGNKGNQHGRLDLQDIYNLEAATASHKAQMLLDQGKYDQALPILTKLQADVPDLAKNEIYQTALRRALDGNNDEEILRHQKAFHDIYFRKEDHELSDDEKKKKYGAALAELNASEDLYHKRGAQIQMGATALQAEQRSLNTQIRDLGTRGLDEAERKFESDRLNRQLTAVNAEIDTLYKDRTIKNDKGQTDTIQGELKANASTIADIAYFQGSCWYQMGELYEANQKFNYSKDNGSAYAANPDYKLDELIHATNWWSRNNWLKQGLYIVAGVTAGIVVGALLTPETGPGGPIAGWALASSIIGGGVASSVTVSGLRLAFGDQVTAGTMIRDFGLGAGGGMFNVTRMAFAPAVMAGTVPRVMAGIAAGTSFGVVDGGANFIADIGPDHQPVLPSAGRYALNVGFSAFAGGFTPMRAFESAAGEMALTRAWGRVVPALKGAAPILVYPTIEGTVVQSGVSTVVDMTHTPVIPRFDRSQQVHDFSKDTDVIDDLNPDVAAPKK